MPIRYGLFVQCETEEEAFACAAHFNGREIKLLSGLTTRWSAGRSDFVLPAVDAISFELSPYGIRTLQDAVDSTEAGLHLLRHLKSAPEFLFARVGIEVGNIAADELAEFVREFPGGNKRLDFDCDLHFSLFEKLGHPEGFAAFRPGYVWRKYSGENYRPLYAGDQPGLNAKCRELFPEYFRH